MAAMTAIKEIYTQNSNTYLDELQWHLAIPHNISISISALQESLVMAGLTQKVLLKVASECDDAHQAKFMHCIWKNFSGTGDEFVVVGESCKSEHSYVCYYGHMPVRQDAILTAPFI